jgi:hypothetical protein
VYQPARVEAGEDGALALSLCYRTHPVTSRKDLKDAPLKHPPPPWECIRTYRLRCAVYKGNYSVVVLSSFNLTPNHQPQVRARIFKYGFVPDRTLLTEPLQVVTPVVAPSNNFVSQQVFPKTSYRKFVKTREYGLTGKYVRCYFDLKCMVSGTHLLHYDGVEQGVMRVNSELSYGRELVDAYTRLLPINKYVDICGDETCWEGI